MTATVRFWVRIKAAIHDFSDRLTEAVRLGNL